MWPSFSTAGEAVLLCVLLQLVLCGLPVVLQVVLCGLPVVLQVVLCVYYVSCLL